MLVLAAGACLAQKTLFTQPVGNDTFKIKADACLWPRYYALGGSFLKESTWTRSDSIFRPEDGTWHKLKVNQDSTWSTERTDNTFNRTYGFVGVTAQFSKYGYLRYYYDLGEINGKPGYDLYAGVACCGFDLRFGQLKLPMGYEVITAPWRVDFIDYTQCAAYRTPTGATRDIGALLAFNHRFFQASVGAINGNGRNKAKDDNPCKDLAFRLIALPLGNQSLVLGGNGYWGNDTAATKVTKRPFQRFAGEVLWTQPSYFVRGEYLYGSDTLGAPARDDTTPAPTKRSIDGFYAAAGYRFRMIQPVVRYEAFRVGKKSTSTVTAGVNGFLFKDMVKPMLDLSLSDESKELPNSEKVTASSWKLTFQLQAAFW
jgi:hypothetical protein